MVEATRRWLQSRANLPPFPPSAVPRGLQAEDSHFSRCVNVHTTDATTGATALVLPAQNTHTLCVPCTVGGFWLLGESGSRGLEGAQRRLDRGSRVPAPPGVFERFTYSRFADFRSSNFVSETEIEGSRVRGVRRCVALDAKAFCYGCTFV